MVGKAVPQFMTGPLAAYTHHVVDKTQQASREVGNIAENKVNTFLAYADDFMSDLDEDLGGKKAKKEPIPAYAKGMEGAYKRQKFEENAPILSGITGGLANLGGQIIGDPTNWPFLAKGIASRAGLIGAEAMKPWVEKLLSKGFGIQMAKGSLDQLDELVAQWPSMDAHQRSKAVTQFIAGTYMAQSALREGFGKGPQPEGPQTVGPEQGGEGPRTSEQTGTVSGERTTLRPTTRTTAGVTAPVSAEGAATLAGEEPSVATRVGKSLTGLSAERDFGKQEVAPAATRQAVSTIGQVAEDAINRHQAIVDGDQAPEQLAGTQHVSRFTTPDEAWQEMQKTVTDTTYAKADEISKREQDKWQADRDQRIQEYKELLDRHNANIDAYNAQVKPEDRMQHAVFDPNEVEVPERPKTFNELRSDVETAKEDMKSGDSAIREEGKKNFKKAKNSLDSWFRGHADEISPAEYDSAQKTWSDSERMKEIAMKLRGSLVKGDLTGNKMRNIEVAINNQQLRMKQPPDAFQRLLGPDGYNNWQNVAKLFDTVKDPSLPEMFKSWGAYATEYLVSALLPHLSGLGIAAKFTVEKLLNHVMFDPEFGSTFSNVVDWLKSRQGLVAQSIKELPGNLRDRLVNVIKSYQDSKAGSERGAAGASVKQGRTPETNKFGRSGLGGQPTAEDVKAASNPERDTNILDQVRKDMPNASLSEHLMEAARRANPKHALGNGSQQEEESAHQFIADWHNEHKGFSYNPKRGFIRDEPVFSVAGEYQGGPYEKVVQGQNITPDDVREFTSRPEVQRALAANPDLNVGGWNYRGNAHLELSRMFEDRAKAIEEGKRLNQDSIYDHANRDTISTGGSAAEELHQQTQVAPQSSMTDKVKAKFGTTDDPTKAGFILPSGEMIPLVGEHDKMIESSGAQGAREDIIGKENAIRMRSYMTKAGRKVTFSIPDKVTEDQIQQIKAAVKKFGPNTVLGIEQGKPGGDFRTTAISGDEATPKTVNQFLRDLNAIDTEKQVADMKAKIDAAQKAKAIEAPQPVYIDRKNGFHEVVTGPESDRAGHLLAKDMPSEKEGEPSTEVRVATHWVDPEMRGKGFGAAQLETMAQNLADNGKTALLSDTKMTDSAKGAWKRLMSAYPIAVTETPEGGYRFDLEKLKAPSVTKTTAAVKGSTVELMKNPLPIKGTGDSSQATTIDVAKALNKYSKRNLGALQPGSEPAEMVERAKQLAEDEARYQLAQNNSGTTWYTEQMDKHDEVAREMRPVLKDDTKLSLFKMAEAILSSGQKPFRNFTATMEAFDHYDKNGSFSPTNPVHGKSWGPRGVVAYGNAFESINRLIDERGEKGAVDWLMSEHPVSELKQYNKNVSGKKTDMKRGVMILGEKRGPFALNLHGIETEFTADMWVSRTWNRWMGTIEIDPNGEEIASDSPRNQQERGLMKQSFAETAEKLGLTTSSLQAVLWYYEQALYTAHGVPKESWSFSDAALRAQAEERAKAPAAPEPKPEPIGRPRGGRASGAGNLAEDEAYSAKDAEFNPSDFE